MATWDDVARLALALPEAEEGTSWGTRSWKVRGKAFATDRPLREGDLAALGDAAPAGPVLLVPVEHLVAKEALLADPASGCFTTPHFDGYPAVLVRLEDVGPDDLGELVTEGWLCTVPDPYAVRAVLGDQVDAEAVAARARELGVLGWVRPGGELHAEGPPEAVLALLRAVAAGAALERVKAEGHEQFGIRGVPAGVFVVQEHRATAHHFDLRLEVDGVMRSWAVPKGPSLDPAAKRLAVEVEDHGLDHNDFEGALGDGGVIVWDRGTYEQGGRVAWPEALDRGHAVFVLHGEKLRGGFALQRTRPRGGKPQWLLVKRRDDEARPGSDVVAERPESVLSGRTLADL